MKDFVKTKVVTGLVVTATVILGGVAIYTGLRLYQLRQQSVALNAPDSTPLADTFSPTPTDMPDISCQAITFSIALSPTPTGTINPSLTATSSPTNSPTATVTSTATPTTIASASPTPTFPPPPSIPEPPNCPAAKPSAPVLTSVQKSGTQAVIKWTAVDLATHYVISYGTSPNNLEFGVPNTGNVTTYTVGSLNSGSTYYFTVYAVNDCMPSEGSTILSSVAGAGTTAESTPTQQELPTAGISNPTLIGAGFGLIVLLLAMALAI